MVAIGFNEAKQKFIASLTTVMMVFALLLPGLSQAVVPKLVGDANTVAVCTQTGIKYIVLEASLSIQDASNQDPSLAKHVQCDYCSASQLTFCMSAPASDGSAPTLTTLVLTYPIQAPRRFMPVWRPANPRAPPSL
jgi:hypothetical protein